MQRNIKNKKSTKQRTVPMIKGNPFDRGDPKYEQPLYQVAFDKLKSLVCEYTTLRYFNTKKPVTIQVDASGKGLGAALIQDDGPVAFASKALTLTEQCYANNERELLPVSFVQNIC